MQIFKLEYVHFTSPVKSHGMLQNPTAKWQETKTGFKLTLKMELNFFPPLHQRRSPFATWRGKWHLDSHFCTCSLVLSASLLMLVQHQLGARPSFTRASENTLHWTSASSVNQTFWNTSGWNLLAPVMGRYPFLFLYWMADVHTRFPQKTKKFSITIWLISNCQIAQGHNKEILFLFPINYMYYGFQTTAGPIDYSLFHSPAKL